MIIHQKKGRSTKDENDLLVRKEIARAGRNSLSPLFFLYCQWMKNSIVCDLEGPAGYSVSSPREIFVTGFCCCCWTFWE